MGRITPYLALAACFVAIMLVGNLVLRSTAGDDIMTDYYSRIAYSDLIPVTEPDDLFHRSPSEQDQITEEDVIDYLITSFTPTELVEYEGLIAQK